jgi:predicted esterase
MRLPASLLLVLIFTGMASAQSERYELGLRLRQFEKAWDQTTDPVGRKRALAIVKDATNQFFSLKFGEAGKTLDSAKWALRQNNPRTENEIWMASFMMKPDVRVVDQKVQHASVMIEQFYKAKPNSIPFQETKLTFQIQRANVSELGLPNRSKTVSVALPTDTFGEFPMEMKLAMGKEAQPLSTITLSRIMDLTERLNSLKSSFPQFSGSLSKSIEAYHDAIRELKNGIPPETDFPVSAMLAHAELMVKEKKLIVAAQIPGQEMTSSWFTMALENKQLAPIRLGVPARRNQDQALPVVFALHGAGGSENMFFDSYGDGQVVRECSRRGWLLVAPRSPGFVASPPVKEILEQLRSFQKIDDTKVFILGHSMGAGQTIDLCQKHPTLFAGAAVMGGGGRIRDAKSFATLPTFIGIGDKDFAFAGAKSLRQSLEKGGATKLRYKEYPDLEHLVIVREALPDAFAMFDEIFMNK